MRIMNLCQRHARGGWCVSVIGLCNGIMVFVFEVGIQRCKKQCIL